MNHFRLFMTITGLALSSVAASPSLHAATTTTAPAYNATAKELIGSWASMGLPATTVTADSTIPATGPVTLTLPTYLQKGQQSQYLLKYDDKKKLWSATDKDGNMNVTFTLISENTAEIKLSGKKPGQNMSQPLFRN